MSTALKISSGQYSKAGIKDSSDDACGIRVPDMSLLNTKGIAAVIADGMSGSEAGKEAAEACVRGFLTDYFTTPESWSAETAGEKILSALNRWLYAQGHHHYESTSAMVTTLSVLVIKSATAHLFHVGDTRIYRMRQGKFECLTHDHRVHISEDKNYLSRAMGIELYASKRTQVYLAQDRETHTRVILKTPSVNYDDDAEYIDRFLHEEWAGRRIKNQHLLKFLAPRANRHCLYYVTEYIEGQTLR